MGQGCIITATKFNNRVRIALKFIILFHGRHRDRFLPVVLLTFSRHNLGTHKLRRVLIQFNLAVISDDNGTSQDPLPAAGGVANLISTIVRRVSTHAGVTIAPGTSTTDC